MIKKKGLIMYALISAAILFFIMFKNFSLVGKFSAESLAFSDAHSIVRTVGCYEPKQGIENSIAISRDVNDIEEIIKRVGSDLYFKVRFDNANRRLYAIDELDFISYESLKSLNNLYKFADRNELYLLADKSIDSFKPCDTTFGDIGVSELYWATKGTAGVHHWAHLYSATTGGKAQYGYFIPYVAKYFSEYFAKKSGPSAFVRSSWVLMYLAGVCYVLLVLAMFQKSPNIGGLVLISSLAVYASIGQFFLLLAPGFGLQRALVLAALGLVYVQFIKSKRLLPAIVLTICYGIDPSFTIVGVLSCGMAFCKLKWNAFRTLCAKSISLSFAVAAVFLLMVALMVFYSGVVSYVFEKLTEGDFQLIYVTGGKKVFEVVLLCMLLVSLFLKNLKPVHVYWVFASILMSTYFYITPDQPHFKYQIICLLPLFGYALEICSVLINKNISTAPRFSQLVKFPMGRLWATLCICFWLIGVGFVIKFVFVQPSNFELRTLYANKTYISSVREMVINNKIVYADLSDDSVAALEVFPNHLKGQVVSAYDVYLNFLFDRPNGFLSPDFISWLDSDKKLGLLRENINGSYIIGKDVVNLDPRNQLLSSNLQLRAMANASKLKMLGRYRAQEFAIQIINSCGVAYENKHWIFSSCNLKK